MVAPANLASHSRVAGHSAVVYGPLYARVILIPSNINCALQCGSKAHNCWNRSFTPSLVCARQERSLVRTPAHRPASSGEEKLTSSPVTERAQQQPGWPCSSWLTGACAP